MPERRAYTSSLAGSASRLPFTRQPSIIGSETNLRRALSQKSPMDKTELVHIGFGNLVAINRVLTIMSPDSAPIKRMVREARDGDKLIDLTYGRKTKAVLVLDSGQLVLAAVHPETIVNRLAAQRQGQNGQ